MTGLVLSEVLLFAIAATLGFAAGWLARAQLKGLAASAVERDVQVLNEGLNEARVRRARSS
jgi:hypothetical protein